MREIWHQSPWDPLLWNQDQVSFLRRILNTESGSPDTRVSFPIYQMHARCRNWNGETLQWPLAGHQEDSRVHSPATHMCLSTDDYCHFVLKRVSSNDFSQLIMFPLRENYVQCTSKECGECDVFGLTKEKSIFEQWPHITGALINTLCTCSQIQIIHRTTYLQ